MNSSTPNRDSTPNRWTLYLSIFLLGMACMLAVVVANYPYPQLESDMSTIGSANPFLLSSKISSFHVYKAGWPFSFYYARSNSGESTLQKFVVPQFILNLLLWSAAISAFLVYEYRIRRRNTQTYKRKVVLSDLFVLTAVVAVVFSYWGRIQFEYRQEMSLRDELNRQGVPTVMTTRIPIQFTFLPSFVKSTFSRISRVWLDNPSTELVQKIARLPNLEVLGVSGGEYELDALSPALQNPCMMWLQVSDRELDGETLSKIGRCCQLSVLNVSRTGITSERLKSLAGLTMLEKLEIQENDFAAKELLQLACSRSIVKLVVSASSVDSSKIEIQGFPNLTELIVKTSQAKDFEQTCDLTCENLPSLRNIELNDKQTFDVKLSNLPKLQAIKTETIDVSLGFQSSVIDVVGLRVRSFRMENVPNLAFLTLHGNSLTRFSMDATHPVAVTLVPSANPLKSKPVPSRTSIASQGRYGMPEALSQASLDAVASASGLSQLAIKAMSVADLDFSKLTSHVSLSSLSITHSGLSSKQLLQLAGMPNLQSIQCNHIPLHLSSSELQHLLDGLPSLRRIDCQIAIPQELSLQNHKLLESLSLSRSYSEPNPTSRRVQLKKLPRFSETMTLAEKLDQLELDGLPRLKVLSILHPVPPNSILKGLRDLTNFAGGGAHLSDGSARAVLKCTGLKSLTMIYAPLNRETLSQIEKLQDLEYLNLTGCLIDDSCLESIIALPKLKSLRLDHTQISSAAIPLFRRMSKLELLSISHTAACDGDLTPLADMKELKCLEIAGRRDTEVLGAVLASMSQLLWINLSNTKLSDAMLNEWFSAADLDLQQVLLRDSQLNGSSLYDATSGTRISFFLAGSSVDADTVEMLRQRGKLLTEDMGLDFDTQRQIMIRTTVNGIQSSKTIQPTFMLEAIDANRFKP